MEKVIVGNINVVTPPNPSRRAASSMVQFQNNGPGGKNPQAGADAGGKATIFANGIHELFPRFIFAQADILAVAVYARER